MQRWRGSNRTPSGLLTPILPVAHSGHGRLALSRAVPGQAHRRQGMGWAHDTMAESTNGWRGIQRRLQAGHSRGESSSSRRPRQAACLIARVFAVSKGRSCSFPGTLVPSTNAPVCPLTQLVSKHHVFRRITNHYSTKLAEGFLTTSSHVCSRSFSRPRRCRQHQP